MANFKGVIILANNHLATNLQPVVCGPHVLSNLFTVTGLPTHETLILGCFDHEAKVFSQNLCKPSVLQVLLNHLHSAIEDSCHGFFHAAWTSKAFPLPTFKNRDVGTTLLAAGIPAAASLRPFRFFHQCHARTCSAMFS